MAYMTIQEMAQILIHANRRDWAQEYGGLGTKNINEFADKYFGDKAPDFIRLHEQIMQALADKNPSKELEDFKNAVMTLFGVCLGNVGATKDFLKMIEDGVFKGYEYSEIRLLDFARNNFRADQNNKPLMKEIRKAITNNPNARPMDYYEYINELKTPEDMLNLTKKAINHFDTVLTDAWNQKEPNVPALRTFYTHLENLGYMLDATAREDRKGEFDAEIRNLRKTIRDTFDFEKARDYGYKPLQHFEGVDKTDAEKLDDAKSEKDELLKQIEQLKKQLAQKDTEIANLGQTVADRDKTIGDLRTQLQDNEQKHRKEREELETENTSLKRTNEINARTLQMQGGVLESIENSARRFEPGLGKGKELAEAIKAQLADLERS